MNDIVFAARHPIPRHLAHRARGDWLLMYCAAGSAAIRVGEAKAGIRVSEAKIAVRQGDAAAFPPRSQLVVEPDGAFEGIYVYMLSPMLPHATVMAVSDDKNHFLGDAFAAAAHHYRSEKKERASFLAAYGSLICAYICAFRGSHAQNGVAEQMRWAIDQGAPDSNFDLEEYLKSLPFSYDYLRKRFRQEFGVTPHQYLSDRRLTLAAQALRSGDGQTGSVGGAAQACGFRDPLYFSRMFKKKFGVSPTAYMEGEDGDAAPENSDPESTGVWPEIIAPETDAVKPGQDEIRRSGT